MRKRCLACDNQAPVSRGGHFSYDNLLICCDPCNRAKGTMTGVEFRELRALLRRWHPAARNNTLARLKARAKFSRN